MDTKLLKKASYADIVSGRRDNGAPINKTSILILALKCFYGESADESVRGYTTQLKTYCTH